MLIVKATLHTSKRDKFIWVFIEQNDKLVIHKMTCLWRKTSVYSLSCEAVSLVYKTLMEG